MKKICRFFIPTICAILILSASTLDAATRITVTRGLSFNHSVALNDATRLLLGGVLLYGQASFLDDNGNKIDAKNIKLGGYDAQSQTLCISYNSSCFNYYITEDDLARILSWLDNDGAALYTIRTIDRKNSLTPETLQKMGFSKGLYPNAYIAKEFSGSALEWNGIIGYLDKPQFLEAGPEEEKIRQKHNQGLKETDKTEVGDWLVSDLDSNFTVKLTKGLASPSGIIYRYSNKVLVKQRGKTNDGTQRIFITNIDRFVDERELSDFQKRIQMSLLSSYFFPYEDRDLKSLQELRYITRHVQALRFARSVALLRTLRIQNRTSYDAFESHFFQ